MIAVWSAGIWLSNPSNVVGLASAVMGLVSLEVV
jgi:hypothetical protein